MRDQLVAVKVFKVDAPPEQAEQIAEALEAVVQALPRHRGLVEFIAAGVERDTAYLVMAHSDVPSLDSRLKPGSADGAAPPVDAEQALVIVRTLAEAMDAAHARGIVHGGLHPRDIFVDDRGVCRAAGFGVATALGRAGVRVPVRRPYSPPERLTSAPIEPPADRFALGAIAFELLTGRRIAGTGSSAAARYTTSVPGADLGAVRNALAAMLAEQPAHRPSTANAFAQALSLALFPQGVARASAATAATGSTRAPAAAGRDDRRENGRGANSAAGSGPGAGTAAGDAGAAASNLSRDGDGPSRDDLELFTREGLFTGHPRQNTLAWEPIEVENIVPPGEDPLSLFAPSPSSPSTNTPSPNALSPNTGAPTVPDASVAGEPSDAPDAPVVEVKRPDSILGLSAAVPAPIQRDPIQQDGGTSAGDADDEGHETTALPFVPILADARRSPTPQMRSPQLDESVLIDDNSRLDAFQPAEPSLHPDHRGDALHGGNHDHFDRFDRFDRHDRDEVADDIDGIDELDAAGHTDAAEDVSESPSVTAAEAAAAGVVAAGGVTAAADLPASHLTPYSHASHTSAVPRASLASHATDASHEAQDVDDAEASEIASPAPSRADRAQADTWVAPTVSVTQPSSMLTNPPETSDVGSSVRVVGLVLALGLAVGGAGGYLLGQRSALRNGSTFEQAERSGAAARPEAGANQGERTGGASSAGAAGATGDPAAPGASAAPGGAGPAASGKAGPASAAGSTAANAPAGASSSTGAARPAAATGRLTITSTPPRGEVAIDGVRRGVTPLTVRDLSFGSHTVRITRGGYAPETRRVNVVAGRPAESIAFELEPTAPRTRPTPGGAASGAASAAPERGSASGLGSLYIVSRPMGARVTVDGRVVGVTPLLLTDVSSGSRTIQLQADGHKPWQTTVQVKIGERTRVAASLEEGR